MAQGTRQDLEQYHQQLQLALMAVTMAFRHDELTKEEHKGVVMLQKELARLRYFLWWADNMSEGEKKQ